MFCPIGKKLLIQSQRGTINTEGRTDGRRIFIMEQSQRAAYLYKNDEMGRRERERERGLRKENGKFE